MQLAFKTLEWSGARSMIGGERDRNRRRLQEFPHPLALRCMCGAGDVLVLTLVLCSVSGSLPEVCSSSMCCCSGASALLGISPEQVAELPARPCSGLYREGGWQSEHSLLHLLLCQAESTNRSAEV